MIERTIHLTEIDNQYYLKLADVERLLHDMRVEIRDNAETVTENGKTRPVYNNMEMGRLNDLFFISSCLRKRLVVSCETPDEIRQLHEKIRRDYYTGKWYLSEKTQDEDGNDKLLYFRQYCPDVMEERLKGEGKTEDEIKAAIEEKDGDPVFTTEDKYIRLFESMEEADSHMRYINHNYHTNLIVHPAFLLDRKGAKKMLEALLRNGAGESTEGPAD